MSLAVFRYEVADSSLGLYWLPSDRVLFTGGVIPGVSSAFDWVGLPHSCSLSWQNSCFPRLPAENLAFVFQEMAL